MRTSKLFRPSPHVGKTKAGEFGVQNQLSAEREIFIDPMSIGVDSEKLLTPGETSETRHQKLKKQALKGTVYILGYYGIALGLRMVSSVVLARLLSPEFFGLMTLLTTVLVGLNLFSHIGLEDSVIQNPRGDDPVFLNTACT